MSGKSRNHKGMMHSFRAMAELDLGIAFKPRARWRGIVRVIRRERGWRFTDAFLFERYRDWPFPLGAL